MGVISDYIKKELDKGFSLKKIKKALLEAGHNVKIVEEELAKFEKKEDKKAEKFFGKIMENKVLWISILAIIILVVIIIIAVTQRPTEEEVIQREQIKLAEKLLAGCEGITDTEERNICILKAAAEADTTEICDEISTEVNDVLYYECLGAIWREDDCRYEGLIGEGDECWYEKVYGVEIDDFDYLNFIYICSKIKDEIIKYDCIGYVQQKEKEVISLGRIDLCQTDNCFLEIALLKEDCELTNNNQSFDICMREMAIEKKDKTFCEKMKDKQSVDYEECEKNFFSTQDFLEELSTTERSDKMDYVYDSAMKFGDVKLCEEMDKFAEGEKLEENREFLEKSGLLNFDLMSFSGFCKLLVSLKFNYPCQDIEDEIGNNLCEKQCEVFEGEILDYCNSDYLISNCESYEDYNVRFICENIQDG
ncbi:hypothetical protein KY345_00335 [Candidatus Woesearchaeota archaeon]|nr:hypothetical protein [Candidatus Woesearchaeota archaeon]